MLLEKAKWLTDTYVSVDGSVRWAVLKSIEHLVWVFKEPEDSSVGTLIVSGSIEESDGVAWTLSTGVCWGSPGNAAVSHYCDRCHYT